MPFCLCCKSSKVKKGEKLESSKLSIISLAEAIFLAANQVIFHEELQGFAQPPALSYSFLNLHLENSPRCDILNDGATQIRTCLCITA